MPLFKSQLCSVHSHDVHGSHDLLTDDIITPPLCIQVNADGETRSFIILHPFIWKTLPIIPNFSATSFFTVVLFLPRFSLEVMKCVLRLIKILL